MLVPWGVVGCRGVISSTVAGIVTCWKGIDLVGAVSWFGVEKMGDQKPYFVVFAVA